jgi:twitching motility two-component system response regulator PilH
MLGMDGFEVMRELQKDPATKDIPVVFVSSKNQKADQAWAKLQGAKGFVPKPINEQSILDEIMKF